MLRVDVRTVVKKFGDFCAVDGLNFRAYAGELVTLLGHNGAGKTTTIHMLTGMIPPTKGDALLNGYSIVRDLPLVRKCLGLCPQHNVLWDQLTVRHTLLLWTGIKGGAGRHLFHTVNTLLADVGLESKAHVLLSSLSGVSFHSPHTHTHHHHHHHHPASVLLVVFFRTNANCACI
jgi:ABC-type multidrug transport system ATPase subunit